jgi:glycosyltransferase involved in cell wall biosynthesis
MTDTGPGGDDMLISVIVPAYNVERFIARTLRSVLAQSHRAIEVLVADDGSTDRTAAIVWEIAHQDPRVRLIRSSNLGVSAARNRAIAQSRGELIAPVDADDLWHPEKLERQLAKMRAGKPELGVVYCWSRGINDDDDVILPVWNDVAERGHVLHQMVARGLAGNGSTPLIKRCYVEAVGGYDETMALNEDWKFYTALAGVCEFDLMPEFLVGYRLHDWSASMTPTGEMERAIRDTTAWIAKTWPDIPDRVYVAREYGLNTYLAFLATRQREYAAAFRYIWRALRIRPSTLFSREIFDRLILLPLHMAGVRRYRWQFWRKTSYSEMPVS